MWTAGATVKQPIILHYKKLSYRRETARQLCMSTYPARSGRPENVALRLYFGPSTTDVFRTFRERYQRTFSGVTFVERPRERRGNVRLQRAQSSTERSQKTFFKRYEYVLSTETFYNVVCEICNIFNNLFSSISLKSN